jgi:transcriptional regulator with XRE-family HTH domain
MPVRRCILMGRSPRTLRHYPRRLGAKLLQIRTALGLSQNGMLERLSSPEGLLGTSISAYERGAREPPLLVLLKYARAANVTVEALINDDLELPERLPAKSKSEGTKRKQPARGGTKGQARS